jgi:hypothetical protein
MTFFERQKGPAPFSTQVNNTAQLCRDGHDNLYIKEKQIEQT